MPAIVEYGESTNSKLKCPEDNDVNGEFPLYM